MGHLISINMYKITCTYTQGYIQDNNITHFHVCILDIFQGSKSDYQLNVIFSVNTDFHSCNNGVSIHQSLTFCVTLATDTYNSLTQPNHFLPPISNDILVMTFQMKEERRQVAQHGSRSTHRNLSVNTMGLGIWLQQHTTMVAGYNARFQAVTERVNYKVESAGSP